MQALPLLLFTLVCLCFVGIGFGSVRREFFLGERRAGTAVIASSLLATCLGASTTLGVVSLAYRNGWSAFWWLGSGCVGLCFLGFLWAGRMRERVSVTTLPQWAETGYGLPARILAALLIVVMWAAVIASQWAAAGAVLASAFGCPIGCGICLAAVVVCTYTAWGGQASVLKTDALQVVLVGIAVGLPVLFLARLGVAPGRLAPTPRLLMTSGGMTFGRWLSMLVVVGGMYVVGPDLCSRVLAARTAATARRGAFVAAAVLLVCALLLTLTGVALRESGVELEEPRDALPYLVNRAGILPAWASSLVSIGLLAALFSSADTCLLTAASVLELDLVKRGGDRGEAERRARWFVGVVGALAAVAFFSIHVSGIREHGLWGDIRDFAPKVPWPMIPFIYLMEIISAMVKPFSLTIRLFVNIFAGHMLIVTLLGFIFMFKNYYAGVASVVAVVLMSLLELFIAFVQAYIFTFLTTIFIGFAVRPEH